MYVYDEYDQRIIEDRVKQFQIRPDAIWQGLRKKNSPPAPAKRALYPAFRADVAAAVPYGQLTSRQVRMMAKIARDYDKGYAHISTRQNVQFNWPTRRYSGHSG